MAAVLEEGFNERTLKQLSLPYHSIVADGRDDGFTALGQIAIEF